MELNFLKEYISNPRTVGAVFPSSKRLAERMVDGIEFEKCSCIVEYGPGTGVFTDELVKRRVEGTVILLIEYNYDFYMGLKEKYYNVENLIIINDSAENINIYLDMYNIKGVDYIVSGLPFASLEKSMSYRILKNAKNILGKHGQFVTFQYTLLKKQFIEEYFSVVDIERVNLNIPPAYVIRCVSTKN